MGRVLKDSWVIFTKDWGVYVVSALILLALSLVTVGLLFFTLSAGLYTMLLRRVREGRKPEIGEVFACFDRCWAYVLAWLLFLGIGLAFAVVIGAPVLLLVVPSDSARAFGIFLTLLALIGAVFVIVYLATVWIYWLLFMADRRLGVIEALKASRAMVSRTGFWTTFLASLVVGLIAGAVHGALSSVTFGVGGLVAFVLLTPWQYAAYSSMYLQAGGEQGSLPSSFPGPSGAWQGGVAYAWSFDPRQPWGAPPYSQPAPAAPWAAPPGAPCGPPPYAPAQGYAPYGPPAGPGWPQAAPPPGAARYGPPLAAAPYGPPPSAAQYGPPPAAAPYGPPPGQQESTEGTPPWSGLRPPTPPTPPPGPSAAPPEPPAAPRG